MKHHISDLTLLAILALSACCHAQGQAPVEISGRYPSLATFNHHGECGTGAVVPWAGRLWVVTYAPHQPNGSDDKLYEIDEALHRVTRPESVGGTPADRMIHRESRQLIIGPYFIDEARNVRVIPPSKMPGRLTAAARHLTDPANRVYLFDMEGALYDVEVHTLEVRKLFDRVAPGAHGKGGYTGQGRLVVANNGASVVNKAAPALLDPNYATDREAAGALAEWDGKTWHMVRRRSFTEVTGPEGIEPGKEETEPLWTLGWDQRSVLLNVLDAGKWSTYRLPKADHSYDPKHGWYTEWPRIREAAPGRLLMNMHGGWFEFPRTFSASNTSGLRPLGSYLKITGDFCGWNGRIVFGCDDAALVGFKAPPGFDGLNSLTGQSNSNLWFTTWDGLSRAGRPSGDGGPWRHDAVKANQVSDPYLMSGYSQRVLHLSQDATDPVTFTLEIDRTGNEDWHEYTKLTVPPHGYTWHIFPPELSAQWIRLRPDRDATDVSACFQYGPGGGAAEDRAMFASLADIGSEKPWTAGFGRVEGSDRGTASFAFHPSASDQKPTYRRVASDMTLAPIPPDDTETSFLHNKVPASQPVFEIDPASVVVHEGKKTFRLPKSGSAYEGPWTPVHPRSVREVVTERNLLNAAGTLYLLPRADAGGMSRIKPVCTHDKKITDFFSCRGLLVLTGTCSDAKPDGHYFGSASGGAWFGDIDDLWKLGKPRGHGGPWMNSQVKNGVPSDPYLMTGYDRKLLEISHDSARNVPVTLEVDFLCDGTWRTFKSFDVPPGRSLHFEFPTGFSAGWVRAVAGADCRATVQLRYE